MPILIDPPRPEAHGRRWSHLVSTTSLDELHAFAATVGIPRRAFEGDHYDVPEERYRLVVAAGARAVSSRELIAALAASGLRMQKRRGDTGIARREAVTFADGMVADVDLIASARDADPRRVFAALAFVVDAAGHFAVVYSVRRQEWGAPGGWREGGERVRDTAVREVSEEVGLALDPEALLPLGYERFRPYAGHEPWSPGRDLLQVYRADLPIIRPPLTARLPDVSEQRWVDANELQALCGQLFWWPLAEATLRLRGD